MDDIETTLLPGTWPQDYDPPGHCDDCLACPLPTVECLGSFRYRTLPDPAVGYPGTAFGDWSDYSDEAFVFYASNGGPGNGEQQLRVRFIIHQNKTPCVLQYREMDRVESGERDRITVNFTSGEIHTVTVPEGAEGDLIVDYDVATPDVGHAIGVVSGPWRGAGGFQFTKQAAKLKKKGWAQYTGGDFNKPTIYRAELVTSSGEPGCALDTPPRLPKSYTGGQSYTTELASHANGHLLDLAHTYHDTRSQDLKDDHHASTPYTLPSTTVEFGKVDYPVDTLKRMVEDYKCGTAAREKFILLQLSAEYLTDDLVANVDAAITAQITDPTGLSTGFTRSGYTTVHEYYLAPDETEYRRVRGTNFFGVEESTEEVYTTLDVGSISSVTCHIDTYTRDLSNGTTDVSQVTFDIPFYADRSWGPIATVGRNLVGPEFTPDPIVNDPYATDYFKQKQVLFGEVHRKGHYTLFTRYPYCDYHHIIDDGYDGGPV